MHVISKLCKYKFLLEVTFPIVSLLGRLTPLLLELATYKSILLCPAKGPVPGRTTPPPTCHRLASNYFLCDLQLKTCQVSSCIFGPRSAFQATANLQLYSEANKDQTWGPLIHSGFFQGLQKYTHTFCKIFSSQAFDYNQLRLHSTKIRFCT